MVDDLQRARLRTGMTREDVTDMLGAPDREYRSAEIQGATAADGQVLYFHMGYPFSSVDGCYLVVELDSRGTYARSFVYEN